MEFFESTAGKRAMWTILNSVMAMGIAYLTFLASDNVGWAITIIPFAQAVSQFVTKALNDRTNK